MHTPYKFPLHSQCITVSQRIERDIDRTLQGILNWNQTSIDLSLLYRLHRHINLRERNQLHWCRQQLAREDREDLAC